MLLIFPFAFCICFIASGHFQRVVPLWVNSIFVSKLLFAVSVVIRRSKAAALKSSLKSLFSHHSLLAKMRPTRRTYFERHQEGKFQYQHSAGSVKFQSSLRHTFWWMLHLHLTFNLFILILENQEKVELIWTKRRDILNKNNFTVIFLLPVQILINLFLCTMINSSYPTSAINSTELDLLCSSFSNVTLKQILSTIHFTCHHFGIYIGT